METDKIQALATMLRDYRDELRLVRQRQVELEELIEHAEALIDDLKSASVPERAKESGSPLLDIAPPASAPLTAREAIDWVLAGGGMPAKEIISEIRQRQLPVNVSDLQKSVSAELTRGVKAGRYVRSDDQWGRTYWLAATRKEGR